MLMILIGTACRPEAALELTGAQLDFEDRLIDLNPRGRAQTKKFRPVVKMPEALATRSLHAPEGRLITFRGQPVIRSTRPGVACARRPGWRAT